MFSKMTNVLILAGSLIFAGAATANERNVIVPVIAGAAVGAVLAAVISNSNRDHDRPRYKQYRPQPRYQPQYYEAVRYVPVRPAEYRRYGPPRRGYYDHGPRRDYGHGRGYSNGRW